MSIPLDGRHCGWDVGNIATGAGNRAFNKITIEWPLNKLTNSIRCPPKSLLVVAFLVFGVHIIPSGCQRLVDGTDVDGLRGPVTLTQTLILPLGTCCSNRIHGSIREIFHLAIDWYIDGLAGIPRLAKKYQKPGCCVRLERSCSGESNFLEKFTSIACDSHGPRFPCIIVSW